MITRARYFDARAEAVRYVHARRAAPGAVALSPVAQPPRARQVPARLSPHTHRRAIALVLLGVAVVFLSPAVLFHMPLTFGKLEAFVMFSIWAYLGIYDLLLMRNRPRRYVVIMVVGALLIAYYLQRFLFLD